MVGTFENEIVSLGFGYHDFLLAWYYAPHWVTLLTDSYCHSEGAAVLLCRHVCLLYVNGGVAIFDIQRYAAQQISCLIMKGL